MLISSKTQTSAISVFEASLYCSIDLSISLLAYRMEFKMPQGHALFSEFDS